jgi:polyhydroxyalkanoate synthesis regulator phasin
VKWDEALNTIAGNLLGFVDDLRASGYSMEEAWAVARQVASQLQYLGIQDAPRKRRPPSQTPGAWAGSVFSTKAGKVTKSVTQEKWTKAQLMIKELLDEADGDENYEFSYKPLEQIRGFLCHMAMTYETITPFLEGLPLTLASFLPQRDKEGWKMSDQKWLDHIRELVKEGKMTAQEGDQAVNTERDAQIPENNWEIFIQEKLDQNQISEDEAQAALDVASHAGNPLPNRITGIMRFFQDLEALRKLLGSDAPTKVDVRARLIITILYGFADASGRGFGSTVLGANRTHYRIGIWDPDTEDESSNFREFENVVETLEEEAKEGHLRGAVIHLCTDNSTVEAALYKGNSSSWKLFDLVL